MSGRFSDLYDHLTNAGLRVGIERVTGSHVLTIVDPNSDRVIRYPVRGANFDAAATTLALSGLLRERLGSAVDIRSGRMTVIGRWPELEALRRPAAPPKAGG